MKLSRIIYLAAAVVLLASCNKFLDTPPDNRASLDTETNIRKLLVNAYSTGQPTLYFESMSDNVDYNGDNYRLYDRFMEEAFVWDPNMVGVNPDRTSDTWALLYKAVAHANQALEAIDKMGNPASLETARGEALMCRAYAHFVLVNIFCQHYDPTRERENNDYNNEPDYLGIPYMTAPETTINSDPNRRNVSWVYAQIEKDIVAGLPLVLNASYDVPRYHFNREAAYAFACEFYLYYCKFEKAVEYADLALGAAPQEKLRSYADLNATSNATVRGALYMNSQVPANFMLQRMRTLNARVWGSTGFRYSVSRNTADYTIRASGLWGPGTNLYTYLRGFNNLGQPHVWVLKQAYYSTDYTEIMNPFSADETLLHRAEALVMLTGRNDSYFDRAADDIRMIVERISATAPPKPVDRLLINTTYRRMSYYTPDVPTAKNELNPKFAFTKGGEMENFIHAILHIRRVLYMHEGNRWLDIKRWGIPVYHREISSGTVYVRTVATLPAVDPRRAVQIPVAVITAGMEANPVKQ